MGAWTAYTPTYTGFSSSPAGANSRYMRMGKLMVFQHDSLTATGTSNANTFTLTIPCTSAAGLAEVPTAIQFADNGAVSTTPGLLITESGQSHVHLYTNWGGAAWNTANGKGARFSVMIECQ